jgi:type IV pilus assembly protein PilM
MLTSKRSKTVVGLDIEADSIAAAEVSTNGTSSLGRVGITPLAPGLFRDGEVADPAELAESLKSFFSEHKLPRNVRVGVANQRVIVRTLRLPALEDEAEIESAVRFQARDHIAMDLDEAVLDWQILEEDPELRQSRQMDVVVVAARRQTIEAIMAALTMAGLRPVGIDTSAFAMIRALAREGVPNHDGTEPYAGEPTSTGFGGATARLLCNFGDVLNLAVARGSSCLCTRVSPFGVEGITQRLAESRNLTLEDARKWLLHVGARRPIETIDGDPPTVEATRQALLDGLSRLAGELRLSIDYYGAQEGAVAFDEILICGGGSAIDGVAEQMEIEVGRQVRAVMPAELDRLPVRDGARLTLPYGLGLEA